jgi:SAM-dependent methyltransferase
LIASLYDVTVSDWLGEIDFYRLLAQTAQMRGEAVLEIGCGTGRVALRLAGEGVDLTGLDLSAEMLEVARRKSAGLPDIRWVQGDMRSFDLGRTFGLVIIPGHSFQFMLTPQDQLACLECIRSHLTPGGTLVVHLDHQDVSWLGELSGKLSGIFEPGSQGAHPLTGRVVRSAHAWTYEPATQTARVTSRWEELDAHGRVLQTWERQPLALHCVFRFEMEHLLKRAGYQNMGVYGDFVWGELTSRSSEMVWVAQAP